MNNVKNITVINVNNIKKMYLIVKMSFIHELDFTSESILCRIIDYLYALDINNAHVVTHIYFFITQKGRCTEGTNKERQEVW